MRAPDDHAPRPEPLAHPPHLRTEQARLAPRVGQLGGGQRLIGPPVLECDGLRQPVGGPVVGDRWPEVLVDVAPRREVCADAGRGLAPGPIGEQAVQAGQGPVGLPRVVLRVHAWQGASGADVVEGEYRTRRLGLGQQEPAELGQQLVVAIVACVGAPLGQPGDQKRRRPRRDLAAVARGSPVVTPVQPAERPRGATVGDLQRTGDPCGSRLVEAHACPHVADDVVVGGGRVALGVVEVQPGAVGLLVAREPVDGLGGRCAQLGRVHGRAVLGRGQHPEDGDGDTREDERGERHAHPWPVRSASHGQRGPLAARPDRSAASPPRAGPD